MSTGAVGVGVHSFEYHGCLPGDIAAVGVILSCWSVGSVVGVGDEVCYDTARDDGL
jgi:hypothetical protein